MLTKSHLAITFDPVVRLNPNFEYGKICRIDDLFAKAVCGSKVVNLGEKWLCWVRMFCTRRRKGVKNGHFWAYILYGWPLSYFTEVCLTG